jgi:hypothetical protein
VLDLFKTTSFGEISPASIRTFAATLEFGSILKRISFSCFRILASSPRVMNSSTFELVVQLFFETLKKRNHVLMGDLLFAEVSDHGFEQVFDVILPASFEFSA